MKKQSKGIKINPKPIFPNQSKSFAPRQYIILKRKPSVKDE